LFGIDANAHVGHTQDGKVREHSANPAIINTAIGTHAPEAEIINGAFLRTLLTDATLYAVNTYNDKMMPHSPASQTGHTWQPVNTRHHPHRLDYFITDVERSSTIQQWQILQERGTLWQTSPTAKDHLPLLVGLQLPNFSEYTVVKRWRPKWSFAKTASLYCNPTHMNTVTHELDRTTTTLLPPNDTLHQLPIAAHWHILTYIHQIWAHTHFLCPTGQRQNWIPPEIWELIQYRTHIHHRIIKEPNNPGLYAHWSYVHQQVRRLSHQYKMDTMQQ